MAVTATNGLWARRITWLALVLSIGGLLAALIAAVGSGQGAWHYRTGLTALRYAFYAAIAGGLFALVGLALSRRGRVPGLRTRNLIALAVALAFIVYLGMHIRTARSVPAIHDISTDLKDVPQFRAMKSAKKRMTTAINSSGSRKAKARSISTGSRTGSRMILR